jgi:predicted ribosome quality control (RQC) complex YloA/Tae2 family protein
LNRLLIVAILVISTAPLYAQAQQPDMAKLKADAQKVISSISVDKAKLEAYCEVTELGGQAVEAAQEKNEKKADALIQRIDELEKILGSEYPALFNALYDADPNSKDVQDILSMFAMLDQSCLD